MKSFALIILFLIGGILSLAKETKEKHQHQEVHKEVGDHHDEKSEESDDHTNEEKDHEEIDGDHHDEHGHEDGEHEEENSSIGPDKGITTFSEAEGFKLSPEAIKNFELQTIKLKNVEPWSIPDSAVLYSGEEINIYRMRNGFYKRIDFSIVSKSDKEMKIRTPELKPGDEVVTQGVAFLRTAEIVATGGAPEGHSH
ncbi:hypothetical protein [Bdellovibrio bacteriovorus]|uniref:hypothetical protein n=1 Tax=Bdellovibrio bacteriovorus TaxID=959 RepID=UPI0035A6808F